ncbi:MAG TPA: TIGR02266 family protein [Geopsychrobacteraceae bacterium]|nr:TIGR02266 family protein [Geopsychrobacteraceae bacterium]
MNLDKISSRRPLGVGDHSIKILLVDDVDLFLELEKTFFRRENVVLVVARSGEEALELVEKEQPDLIFLDLYMTGINGDEVCRLVKQDEKNREIPIIMVLQPGSDADEQLCREAGCRDIIYKPVRKSDFISAAVSSLSIAERAFPRIDASLMVSFGLQPKKFLENFTVNISEGGLFIATGAILTVDTLLTLEFQIPEQKKRIFCQGRVAWVNHPDWLKKPELPVGMGVEFVDVNPENRELLQLFIEQQKSRSSVL